MTCALTMFINLRLRFGSEAYLGDFDDFTPNWFKNIGYSLGMTFFIKILATIFWGSLQVVTIKLKRCLDTCCLSSPEFTKQVTQRDYVNVYKNPDFSLDFSYTEVINTIFVMMTLAPLLPYIGYVASIYLFVLYWKDKLMCTIEFYLSPTFLQEASSVR
jgi:hypothetical protein